MPTQATRSSGATWTSLTRDLAPIMGEHRRKNQRYGKSGRRPRKRNRSRYRRHPLGRRRRSVRRQHNKRLEIFTGLPTQHSVAAGVLSTLVTPANADEKVGRGRVSRPRVVQRLL